MGSGEGGSRCSGEGDAGREWVKTADQSSVPGFDLGCLQLTNEKVGDVVLPAWAKSPEDFIQQHRQALVRTWVIQPGSRGGRSGFGVSCLSLG